MFGWVLLIIVIAVVAFFLTRTKKTAATNANPVKQKAPYAGLSFVADPNGCNASKRMSEKRFLLNDAPNIPLSTCSDPDLCRCKYRDVSDRRDGDDRRNILGALSVELPIGDDRDNRRSGRDRRKDDISFD